MSHLILVIFTVIITELHIYNESKYKNMNQNKKCKFKKRIARLKLNLKTGAKIPRLLKRERKKRNKHARLPNTLTQQDNNNNIIIIKKKEDEL